MPSHRSKGRWFLAAAALAVAGGQTTAAAQESLAQDAAPAAAQVREEELLLFAVDLGGLTITDSMAAYGDPADPLIPIGELSRLLDLNVDVSPGERRITGRIGEAQRPLTVDLDSGLARIGGKDIKLGPEDVATTPNEIYIRASAVPRLLPVKISPDTEGLLLNLEATEKLPIQARLERVGRLRDLRPDVEGGEAVLEVESPYRFFTMPAFDVALSTERDSRNDSSPRRYDVRVGGDVFYTGFQGFIGSDDEGKPSSARVLFERHNPKGGLLGPINATSAQAGDTFTPTLAMGPRSMGGRGFTFTTAPLEDASVFSRIDLRGELPLGYDVELYVNDVLRSGQRTPVEGRYEFLQVPLSRGLNIIRIVLYGPRGERSESTRVVNVGGGQLEPGRTTFDFGVVQQETPMVQLSDDGALAVPGSGRWRMIGSATHGISEKLTVTAGGAYFPDDQGEDRSVFTVGARTSIAGFAVQADAARDDKGGLGFGLGVAGQVGEISVIGRHTEYRGGFVDETSPGMQQGKPLLRHSEITVDASVAPGGRTIPIAFRAQRDLYEDESSTLSAGARASTSFGTVLVSGGLDYRRQTVPDQPVLDTLVGVFSASTYAAYKWQVRAALDYEAMPEVRPSALSVTADRALSETMALRFGVGHNFGGEGVAPRTSLQGGANWRLRKGDLAISGDYTTDTGEWRVAAQYAVGFIFNPFSRRYTATSPGPASGGSVALQGFVDSNGNGRFDPGEQPQPGILVSGGEKPATTTLNGQAFLTGLGNAPVSRVNVTLDDVDNLYLASPPSAVQFSPRPGGVTQVLYPLTPTGEVFARIVFRQASGNVVGLSAVRVLVAREGKEPVEGMTEFDGSVSFESLPAGRYTMTLEAEQAKRLRMRLKEPISFVVDPEGGFVSDLVGEVVFDRSGSE